MSFDRKEYGRQWYAENRDRLKPIRQRAARERKYGKGSQEHLLKQVESQGNKCGICKEVLIESPHLDHNHETGQLRGALCARCNLILGILEPKLGIELAIIKYLNKWDMGDDDNE